MLLVLEILIQQDNVIHLRHLIKETCKDAHKMVNNIKHIADDNKIFVEILDCIKIGCVKCINDYDKFYDYGRFVIGEAYYRGYTNVKLIPQRYLQSVWTTEFCVQYAIKHDTNIKYKLINILIKYHDVQYYMLRHLKDHMNKKNIVNYIKKCGNGHMLFDQMLTFKMYNEIIQFYVYMDSGQQLHLFNTINENVTDENITSNLCREMLQHNKLTEPQKTFIIKNINSGAINAYLKTKSKIHINMLFNHMVNFKMFNEIFQNYEHIHMNNKKSLLKYVNPK